MYSVHYQRTMEKELGLWKELVLCLHHHQPNLGADNVAVSLCTVSELSPYKVCRQVATL